MITPDIVSFFSQYIQINKNNKVTTLPPAKRLLSKKHSAQCSNVYIDSKLDSALDLARMPSISTFVSVATYKEFFGAFEHITDSTLIKFENFFSCYTPHATRLNDLKKKEALRFNVFSFLGICEHEGKASRFIASLLNPNGMHDQGPLFLRSFFKSILNDDIAEQDIFRAIVSTEECTDTGRLDILIEVHEPEYRLVVIENKINASEGKGQIEKYQKWLKEQKTADHKIVFLTPSGRISKSQAKISRDEPEVISLSYSELVEWLKKINDLPERIKFAIHQFCEIYEKKGVFMDAELQSFLKQRLSIAWDISDAFFEVRDNVYSSFWDNVARFITEKLNTDSENWSASATSGKPHVVSIKFKNDGRLIKFGAKMYSEENKDCSYGIWLSSKNKNYKTILECPEVKKITEILQKEKFKPVRGKIAAKKVKDIIGMELRYRDKDSLLFMDADNNGDQRNAIKIAKAIFELFEKYQSEITAINERFHSLENNQTDSEQDSED